MRRFLSLLLALLLWSPATAARAELPLVYPAQTVVSVVRLTRAQRALVAYLYEPVLAGKEKIDLPAGTRYDDVGPAMTCLMLDYPEMFHVGNNYTITYWENSPDEAIAVTPTYRMDAETAMRLRELLYREALSIIRADRTALGLHDALVARVSYGGSETLRHTAVGALLYGAATCEGYAQALTLLYRMAGIPCGVVTGVGVDNGGNGERHAWNIADIAGYTLIDATWNDQESSGLNTRWYYGLSTRQMAADHTPDATMDVPACSDYAGWHRSTGRFADDWLDVYCALQTLVRTGEPVNLRIVDDALYQSVAGDTGAMLDAYNSWCSDADAFYGGYAYLTCDAQRCIVLMRTD